jgi:hypothetical protein
MFGTTLPTASVSCFLPASLFQNSLMDEVIFLSSHKGMS